MKNLIAAIKPKWIVITLFFVFIFLLCCRVGQTAYTLFDSSHNVSNRLEVFKQAATPFPLVVKWTRSLSKPRRVPLYYQDGLVFFRDNDNIWHALKAHTGAITWSQSLPGRILSLPDGSLVCQQPDALIIENGAGLFRIEPQTGKVIWQLNENNWSATCTDDLLVVIIPHGLIKAFDLATGTLRWQDVTPSNQNFTSYLVYNREAQTLLGLVRNPDRSVNREILHTIEAETGHILHSMDDPFSSGGMLLGLGKGSLVDEGRLFAHGTVLDLATDQISRKPYPIGWGIEPTITAEKIYVPADDDGVWAVNRDTLRFRWQYIPTSPLQDQGVTLGTLTEMVILDNVGYIILSDATLRAIDLDSGKELGRWQPEDEVLAYWPLGCLNYPLGDCNPANITASEEMVIVSFGGNKLYALGRPDLDNSEPTHHHYADGQGNDQSYSQFSYALALLWSALADPETRWAMFGLILMVLGMLISTIGSIWVIVIAFQEDFGKGLACIFIPYIAFVYTIKHCRTKTGKPFLLEVVGAVLLTIGISLWLPYHM